MKLRYKDLEIEGKDQKEIDWLLERVKRLASELKPAGGGEGSGRGRRKIFINFPKGKFLAQEVADAEQISVACVNQRLLEMEAAGDAVVADTKREPGSRGRPSKLWKIIKFPTPNQETKEEEKFAINLDEVPE